MHRHITNTRYALAVLALSMVAVLLVWDSANREPFVVYRLVDFIEEVVLGSGVMLAVGLAAASLVIGIVYRRLSILWLPAGAWLVVLEFYLWFCPFGYLIDMASCNWRATF